MTLDEAIESLKYDIEIDMYIRDIAPQLAEWLEELKDYRDKNKMVVRIDVKNLGSVTNKAIELAKEQYNRAIDDFVEKAIKIVYESNNRDINPQPRDMVADIHYRFIELAKQLKVGDGE